LNWSQISIVLENQRVWHKIAGELGHLTLLSIQFTVLSIQFSSSIPTITFVVTALLCNCNQKPCVDFLVIWYYMLSNARWFRGGKINASGIPKMLLVLHSSVCAPVFVVNHLDLLC